MVCHELSLPQLLLPDHFFKATTQVKEKLEVWWEEQIFFLNRLGVKWLHHPKYLSVCVPQTRIVFYITTVWPLEYDVNTNSLLPSQPRDPTQVCQSFHTGLVMIQVRTWIPSALQFRTVLTLSLAFLTLPLWRLQRAACSLFEFIWWFVMFFGWLGPGLHLWQEDHRNAIFFSL